QRERLSNLDFALVEAPHLEKNGFVLETLDGATPDSLVNKWHRDLIHLSGARILDLANELQTQAAFCRRRKQEVRRLIKASLDYGWIEAKKIRKELLDEVVR